MHVIEYDGANQAAPWKITTDSGEQWHATSEARAAAQLLAWIIQRQALDGQVQDEGQALPEGAVII
jgi:hypothetical protein